MADAPATAAPLLRFATAEEALRAVYGYDAFRGVQADAIAAALAGEDALVVMATGGGKSLCYQIPPLVLGRPAIVVSPLVSLMQDQVLALQARGVAACFLGSAQADATLWRRLGDFQFVYVTPELAATERLREAAAALAPCLIAVDEAHCVSEWGHDFRPEYRQLHELRAGGGGEEEGEEEADALRGVPLMAVTATATPRTRDDICANLALRAPRRLALGVDRPNLVYTALPAKTAAALEAEVRAVGRGAAIVYVPTTREAEEVAARLERALGRPVGAYHAKMERAAREEVHRAFVRDALTTVVATLAFGMGIDKPDVRLVAHYGAPKTLESYYQQAGRAGRDGEPARCVLLHAAADWPRMQALLTRGVDEGTAARARAGLRAMRAFCDLGAGDPCRRAALAAHFGDAAGAIRCGACDVCRAPARAAEARVDATDAARALLAVVRDLEGWYGLGTALEVCRGVASAKHARLAERRCFGAGAAHAAPLLQAVADACRARGLLEDVVREPRAGVVYAAPALTEAGAAWLADADAALDVAAADAARAPPSRGGKRGRAGGGGAAGSSSAAGDGALAGADAALFERLRVARRAAADGLPPYMVCSDATLREIARRKPRTRAALLDVPGIGRHKVETFGDALLAAVAAPP